jgi:hypothetical protein
MEQPVQSQNPHRDPQGRYIPLAALKWVRAKQRLNELRSFAPTVLSDAGPFAALGVVKHRARIKKAEIEAGLWQGRAMK